MDGRGERNKIQAINEVVGDECFQLHALGVQADSAAGPEAALVIYEVTMQFPPKSVVRYSRVYIS